MWSRQCNPPLAPAGAVREQQHRRTEVEGHKGVSSAFAESLLPLSLAGGEATQCLVVECRKNSPSLNRTGGYAVKKHLTATIRALPLF